MLNFTACCQIFFESSISMSDVFCLQYAFGQATAIAGFAHDSLIWGMFAAVLNRTNPELFVSESGEYTLMNLFGDGSTHPDTNSNPAADMTRIGWPGTMNFKLYIVCIVILFRCLK